MFNYSLNKGAILFLGPSEALTGSTEFFTPLDTKWKIYRKVNVPGYTARILEFPFSFPTKTNSRANRAADTRVFTDAALPVSIQKILLTEYVPPSVNTRVSAALFAREFVFVGKENGNSRIRAV